MTYAFVFCDNEDCTKYKPVGEGCKQGFCVDCCESNHIRKSIPSDGINPPETVWECE